ncbi:PEPxxWA-CTERM sorting domain-containing protein [Sphingomonas sp. TREG-RG-20F-R18-01]|uniref:PEPxxWA-CTERM sorting domain-containing protein n=1 Tax=Sphingomonas sp. TREG-RG-20F-R18-01 TaxID=2914982 RepID=UPI001F56DD7F|nr:PEPxxWA-CTERM sorting domain-containing protein [Sphingomonas sp. TREG-RG-20F-R18-01]
MKLAYLLAAGAAFVAATSAEAATLISADVTGPSGTIWTTRHTGNYTVFLQSPGLGNFLNPNDESINFNVANTGVTRVLLAGEGYTPGTNIDSDPLYNLTLKFDGGQTLTGVYTPATNTFDGGTSFVDGNTTYSLIEFSYRRFLGDAVQPNVAVPGGDGNDYVGNFRISAVSPGAVPEPATWAMMLMGFGLIGAGVRASRKGRVATRIAYA